MAHGKWDNTESHGIIKDGIELTRKTGNPRLFPGDEDGGLDRLRAHRSPNSGNLVVAALEQLPPSDGFKLPEVKLVFEPEDAIALAEWILRTFKKVK